MTASSRIETAIDQDGDIWQIVWGILYPEDALKSAFNMIGPFERVNESVTFQDPLHRNETKTLLVYIANTESGPVKVAIAEITPGIYAVGRKGGDG